MDEEFMSERPGLVSSFLSWLSVALGISDGPERRGVLVGRWCGRS